MDKRSFIGSGINFLIVLAAFIVMIFGGLRFFIVSLIFFGVVGIFEQIIMSKFYGPKTKIKKRISPWLKIQNGFLWVHGIMRFIKINGTTIYDYKKLGYLASISAYFIMLLYIIIAYFLFQILGYWGLLIYLWPVLTNISFFLEYKYAIF